MNEIERLESLKQDFDGLRMDGVPVAIGDKPQKRTKGGNPELDCAKAEHRPRELKDLTGGYEVFFSSLEEKAAAKLNIIPFASISGKSRSLVVTYSFLQYLDTYCHVGAKDYKVLWGAGVQLTLHIKDRKASVKSAMASLAAAVEYGRAFVEYRLKTIGVIGEEIRLRISRHGRFTVDNYAKIVSNVDEIVRLMSHKSTTVTPQLILVKE